MTDIETKALALLNEVLAERGVPKDPSIYRAMCSGNEALCRAIEQHEAFRQEVSDAVESLCNTVLMSHGHRQLREMLSRRFIIAKPDPLVEIMAEVNDMNDAKAAEQLREALAKRGGKIVWED